MLQVHADACPGAKPSAHRGDEHVGRLQMRGRAGMARLPPFEPRQHVVFFRRAADLDLQSFKTIDGRRAAEISLRGVRGELLGREGEGVAALEACRDRAIGACCGMASG